MSNIALPVHDTTPYRRRVFQTAQTDRQTDWQRDWHKQADTETQTLVSLMTAVR